MITAALTKNLSHYSATGHMSLAACSIVSHVIFIFFSKYLFPLALERRRKCANIIAYTSGSLSTLAQVYCTSFHFLSSPHSSKELMSHLNPYPWSWLLEEWQKLSFWLPGLWNAPPLCYWCVCLDPACARPYIPNERDSVQIVTTRRPAESFPSGWQHFGSEFGSEFMTQTNARVSGPVKTVLDKDMI